MRAIKSRLLKRNFVFRLSVFSIVTEQRQQRLVQYISESD